MIQTDQVGIKDITLHYVSADENKNITGTSMFECSPEDEETILKKIFLKPFTSLHNTFEFKHEVNLDFNVLFNLTKEIKNGSDFIESSGKIISHLIQVSSHPNIKNGDVFIVKFRNIGWNDRHYEALGIYKFEDKESFLETSVSNKMINYSFRKGIGSKKPDKACLIIFTGEPYTLLIIDNNSQETDYWQNDFINQKPKNDFVNNTSDFLTITKNFITTQIPEDFEVTKADQIDYLNRSVEYFKTHDSFNKEEFETEVFHHENIIHSFRRFDQNYRRENDIELSDHFEISDLAVKKQARIFKSVLKLDKNFHIYIHGNREMIERGVDADGRKYYKIYYENES